MSMGLAFWILMLILFLHDSVVAIKSHDWKGGGMCLVMFLLLLLLGWRVFGAPIHD